MVTAVILPLSSEYSEAKTFTNDGLYYMSEYDNTKTLSLSWDHTKPGIVTVGTDEITLGNTGTIPYTLICSEDFIVRYTNTGGTSINIQAWAEDWGSSQYQASVYNGTDMSISISSGTITLDNGSGTTKTYTYSDSIYMISKNGDYVMKSPSESVYVKYDTTVIIGAGRSSVGGSLNFWITGTLEDGFTIGNTYGDNISPTFSDITSTDTEINGYIDLYAFDNIKFTATTSGTDYDVTYSQVIVPAEVSADPDNPAAYKSLVMVIPLMSFVVLVVAAAAMIYLKKD